MENMNISAVGIAEPKHKWLAKVSRSAKKMILSATTFCCMLSMCMTQAFAEGDAAATGAVDTSSFITTACTVLKSVICLIGAGVGVWGVVNLIEKIQLIQKYFYRNIIISFC